MAHRRRAFFLQIFSICLLVSKICFFFGFVFLFSTLSSGLSHPSLPVSFPLAFLDAPLCLKLQRVTYGSDHLMGISQRSLNLTPLENALWVEDVDGLCNLRCPDLEACPHMLSVKEIFPIVFLSVCRIRCIPASPIYLSRRFRSSPMPALVSHHPWRPVSATIFALAPPPYLKQSCNASGFLGFLLMGLNQYGSLSFSSWVNNLSGGPLTMYTWPKSVTTYFLTHSCDFMSRHIALTGRGLRSKSVATWIQVLVDHYPARSNQVQLSYIIHYPHWLPSMAKALFSGASFAWLRSVFFTSLPKTTRMTIQYLDLNVRGHRSCLVLISLRWFWDRTIRTLFHKFYLFTLPNYSFKRRILISSLWERSFSPSIAKERILPQIPTLEVLFPSLNLLSTLMLLSTERLCYVSSLSKERTLVLVSLLNRDVFPLIDVSMKVFPLLTALPSSVMVHTEPVEATMITPVRIEVSEVSKSHVKLTTLQSVDELELKTLPLMSMTSFNTSPDNQSSLTKLVYLSLIYVCACIKFAPVMLNLWICPIMLLSHVIA